MQKKIKKKSNVYFEELVEMHINNIFNICIIKDKIKNIDNNIEYFDNTIWELRKIYKFKKKYNLKWAFENAYNTFDSIIQEIIQKQLIKNIKPFLDNLKYKDKESYNKIYEYEKKIEDLINKKEKIIIGKSIFFKTISKFVIIFDLFILFIFIFLVSVFSNYSKDKIENLTIMIFFIIFVSMFKVFMEKYFFQPFVENIWRKLYIKSLKSFKDTLAIYEAVFIAIQKSIKFEKDIKVVIEIMEKSLIYMQK